MNNNEIMREYANILEEGNKQVITESIEEGICDVVQSRLTKTMGMVENLMMDLEHDEGTEDTQASLKTLLGTMQQAWADVNEVKATLHSAPGMPAADMTGMPTMTDLTGQQ